MNDRVPIIAPQTSNATTPTASMSVRTRKRGNRICTPRDETRLAPNPSFQATLPPVYKNPFRKIGPYCSLGLVTGRARPMDIRVAMTNTLGFWGKIASLIFARCVPN
jgi:hypothetical protein